MNKIINLWMKLEFQIKFGQHDCVEWSIMGIVNYYLEKKLSNDFQRVLNTSTDYLTNNLRVPVSKLSVG